MKKTRRPAVSSVDVASDVKRATTLLHQSGSVRKRWTPPRRVPVRSPLARLLIATLTAGVSSTALAANHIVVSGRTDTRLDVNGGITDITTNTIKNNNAFNSFTHFEVSSDNIVNLHLPGSTQNLINLVDNKIQVDGTLNSLYSNGKIGGNVFFASPQGFVVGAGGVINVGALTVATPTAEFMNQVIDASKAIDDASLTVMMGGEAPVSADGLIRVQGQINALDSVSLQGQSIDVSGQVQAGAVARTSILGQLVNIAGMPADVELVQDGGTIRLVGRNSVTVSGEISANRSSEGTILIAAVNEVEVNAGTADVSAVVDVSGKVSGGNVIVKAEAKTTAKYDGNAADEDFVSDATELADMLEDVADLAQGELELGLVQAKADAKVIVRESAELDASHDLTLQAKAERSATTPAIEAKGENEEDAFVIGAVLGSVSGTTSVEVLGGATLAAGGDMTAKAESINQVDIEATSTTADEESYLAATLAYGHADVDTSAKIAAGAGIDAVNVRISARNDNEFSVKSSAKAVGEAVIGAAVAITDFRTAADAELAASLAEGDVRGDLLIDAQSHTSKNFVKATTDTGAKDGGSKTKKIQAAAGKIDDFVNKKQEKAQGKADKAAGEAEGSPVKLASALALSSNQHDARARIADNAAVDVAGNVAVVAKVRDEGIRNIATSNVEAQKEQKGDGKVTGSAVIAIGSYAHNAEALIGSGVRIEAERIGVDATVELPLTVTWWKWDAADGLIDNLKELIDGKTDTELGAPEQLLTTYANATGTTEGLGFAGAISYFEADNHARAWVDDNATLTSRATPVTAEAARWETELSDDFKIDWDDVISVRALSQAESINVAGNFKLTGLATTGGSDAASVGGAFNWVNYGNTAQAGIGAGAKIDTQGLAVKANSKDWVLAISPTSGGGTSIAGNAILALTQIDNVTHASISHDANVRAKRLELDALQEFSVLSIAGAFVKSEAVAGAAGLAFNDVQADTRAFIGDNRDVDEDDRQTAGSGRIETDALLAEATTDGQVVSLAVAGAVASSADPKPEPEPDPDKKPGFIDKKKEQLQGKLQNLQTKAQEKLDQLPLVGSLAGSLGKKEGEQDNAPPPQETQTKPKVGLSAAGAVTGTISQLDTQAYVDGVTVGAYTADGTVDTIVRAKNDTDLIGAAGAAAFTKANKSSVEYSAAVAGAAAFNVILNDTYAGLRGATLNDAGNVSVQALSAGDSIAIGIAPAINASKGDSSVSVAGSASLSWIANNTIAEIDASTIYGAGDLDVTAYDRSRTINGGGSVNAGGKYGLGVALSVAHVSNTAAAAIKGGMIAGFDDVSVSALSSSRLISAAATGGGSKDGTHLVGSFVFNDVANTVYAGINGGADISADGDVRVLASGTSGEAALDAELGARRNLAEYTLDRGDAPEPEGDDDLIADTRFGEDTGGELIIGVAGAVGAGDNAAGLSFVGNVVRNAYLAVIEEATVISDGLVTVKAQDSAQIIGVAAGVAVGKKTFAGMGSGVANVVTTNVNARVGATGKDRTHITAGGLDVIAHDAAELWAGAGSVAASKGKTAVGASVAFNATIDVDAVDFDDTDFDADKQGSAANRGTSASIDNATVNLGAGVLKVDAYIDSAIRAIAIAGTGSSEVAIGGSLTFNIINDVVSSSIASSKVDAGSVSVIARDRDDVSGNRASIWSLAGNVVGSSGKAAIGAAIAVNTIANTVATTIDGSTLTVGGNTTAAAETGSEIYSIAVAGGGAEGVAAGISSTVNTITKSAAATVKDSTITDGGGSGSLDVRAGDRQADGGNGSTIWSLAGNVQGAGKVAVGLAVSVNNIVNELMAEVVGSTVTLDGAVGINADSGAEIRSAAVAGGGAGKAAVMGAATLNHIINSTTARLAGGKVSAANLTVHASERNDAAGARTSIRSLAGNAAGAGTASIGASVAENLVTNTVLAEIDGGEHSVSGDTQVTTDSGAEIVSIAVGGGGAGNVAAGASVTVNTIVNSASARVSNASLGDGVDNAGSLSVTASDRLADGSSGTKIWSLAGNVEGAGTAAVGVASAVNTIVNTLAADILDSTIDVGGKVEVDADSATEIKTAAMAGGGAGTAAVMGGLAISTITNTVQAKIDGGSIHAGDLSVRAAERDDVSGNRSSITSLAGVVAGAGTAAVGSAVTANTIVNTLRAEVDGVSDLLIVGDTSIVADSGAEIYSAAVGGGGAGTAAVGASLVANTIARSVTATLSNSTLSDGAGNAGNLTVRAHDRFADGTNGSRIWALAGNVQGAGTAAVGGAMAINTITNATAAKAVADSVTANPDGVMDLFEGGDDPVEAKWSEADAHSSSLLAARIIDSDVDIGGQVRVDTDSGAEIKSAAVAGGGAGAVAVMGSVTVNTIASTSQALIEGGSVKASDVQVEARERGDGSDPLNARSSIWSLAGAVSGSGTAAVNVAVAVNTIANTLEAAIDGSIVDVGSGGVVVEVAPGADIKSAAVGGGGSGGAAVTGSVTVNTIANRSAATIKDARINAGSVDVLAADRLDGLMDIIGSAGSVIWSVAGAVQGAGAAAVGLASAVNTIVNTLAADVIESDIKASGDVSVKTDAGTEIRAAAAGGGGAGGAQVQGSVTVNTIANTSRAKVEGGAIEAAGLHIEAGERDEANPLSMRSSIWSMAGAVGGAGAAAINGALAVNTIINDLEAVLTGATVDAGTGDVSVDVKSGAEIRALAASAGGAGAAAVTGSTTVNTIANSSTASVIDSDITSSGLYVRASDQIGDGSAGSSIWSLAGNANGAGKAAVGAAAAANTVANTLSATVVDSTLSVSDTTQVEATENAEIMTLSADGGGAGAAAVGGSASVNNIANTVRAGISGSSNDALGNATTIAASDHSSIHSIAGSIRGAGGVGAAGAAAINRIGNTIESYISGNRAGNYYDAKNVVVKADSAADIQTLAVGAGGGGAVGVAGSVATNILDTEVTARIDSGAKVRGQNNVGVLAQNQDQIEVAAGAAGIGLGMAGAAGSAVVNIIDSQTRAFISGAGTDVTALAKDASDTLTVNSGELISTPDMGGTPDEESFAWYDLKAKQKQISGLAVNAFSTQQVGSVVGTLGGSMTGAGIAGTSAVHVLAGATQAYVDAGATVNGGNAGAGAGQDVDIQAASHSYVSSFATGAAIGGAAGLGGALTSTTISRQTSAYADNARIDARDAVRVAAQSAQGVRATAVSLGGGTVGGAGVGVIAVLDGTTEAYLNNNTVSSADLDVIASSRAGMNLVGGSAAAGGGAIGGALAVAVSDSTTRAYIRGGQVNAGGAVGVNADSDTSFWNLAVSGAAGGIGVAGMAAVNIVSNTTEAYLDGARIGSSGAKAGAVTVTAEDNVAVRSYGGAVGAGVGAGLGAAANVTVVQSRVASEVINSNVYARNALKVSADSGVDAEHVTASAGLSVGAGLSGAASLILLGNGTSGEAMSELNKGGDGILSKVFGLASGDKISGVEGLDSEWEEGLDNATADSRASLRGAEVDRLARLGDTGQSFSQSEIDRLNSDSSYDVAKHFGGGADADVTRAAISGGTIAAGSVSVTATDRSRTSNTAGAAGVGGTLGAGGGVAITRVYNDVQAIIAASSLSSGNVTIAAKALNGGGDAAHALAFAGGAGPVGLGAAWADAYVENAVIAIVDGSVGSSDKVAVTAQDDSRVHAESIGAAAGAGAVGISVAMAEKSSTVDASVGGVLSQAGSLDVIASAAGRVASRATGAAGGLAIAGTGAGADAFDRSKVTAQIADGARIDVSGTSLIEATATPQTSAEALGVAVSAGIGVGASVAKAKAETEVEASIGDGAVVHSDNLSVLARNLTPTNNRTAFAKATGASGGFLWGANATVADASSNTDVHAVVDASALVTVPGTVAVGASNFSKQRAEALGIAAGIVAVGANLASASSNAVSDAHFDARLSGETERLSVSAIGEDDNHAQAIAGSGGVVAGHAAVADTVSNSRTTAELQRAGSNQLLKAGMIVVDATHTTRFNGEVDSVQAAVVGMSGAITRHRVNTDTGAIVGAGAKLEAQDLVVKATDIIRKDWLSDYNIRAAGGGVASGAAADGDIHVTQSTDAIIGEHAVISVTGRRADAHQFEVAALNDFKIYDKSKLDTGGVIAVAAAANRIDVNSHAKVSIGRNATLDSVGGINLYGHTYGRVEANANAKTYGVAGAAQGDSQALITASQTIDVETGASLRADGEIRLGAGRKPDGTANNIYATALTDTWNKTAFPISILSATGRVDETATINLAEGSKLRGVTDIVLLAEKGQIGGSGRYTGMDLYRKAMQEAANAIGKLVGAGESSWELSGGTSTTRGGSSLRLDGLVESGIQNKQFLTIGWDAEREEHFIERVSDEGITYRVGEETLASGLQARLEALYASRDEYAGNNEAVTAYNLEIQRLEQQLRELNNATGNDPALPRDVVIQIIDVAPILAAAGNIRIEGDNLAGSGQLISPGDAQIEVINKTPYFLRLDDLLIPDEAGGFIRYNGSIVRDNASINAINAEGSAAFSQVITGENSPEPSILVKNTFDPNAVGVDSLGMPAPDIYLNGNIRNLQGAVTVQSVAGSVIADGLINAKTINLSAGRDFVLGYVDAFRHIGASPEGLWSDITRKLETGEYRIQGDKVVKLGQVWNEVLKMYLPGWVEVTTTASRDSSGALIAGNNVYISGRYLNINGTIQSGIPDWNLDIGNLDGKIDAANAAYQQRLAKGNADPYIELVNWSQGNDPKQSRKVTAWWNAQEQRIELDGIQVEGGYMELFGEIISTGGGELKVLDGYGQIIIDNKSGKDLVLRNLDVGHGVEGTIKITDLGKQNGSGKPLTTLYKRVGSNIQVWDNDTVDAYGNPTRLVQSHRDTRSLNAANGYKPTAGQRYYWLTGEAKTDHEKFHEERTVDQAFGIPLDWLIPPGYAYDNPQWRWSVDGRSLSEGQYLKNAGSGQYAGYTFRKDTHATSSWEYGEWVRWDKCTKSGWIFGCFQRRYYAEQERWRGTKDVFTHSVAADKGIAINFIGYDQGLIDVKSNAGLLLSGLLHNPDGTINLQGSYIEQLSGNALIIGKDVNLSADHGIGTQHASGSQAGLRTDIGGVLTAATGSGDIRLADISGDLRVNRAVTSNGDVDLGAQNSLVMVGSGASNVIRGRNITLTAKNGSIGSSAVAVNLDTGGSQDGLLNAVAGGDIYLKETSGDLWLESVRAGGDVYIEALDGSIVDGNRNEARDSRTEAELLALWDNMALVGDEADAAAEQGLLAYAQSKENEYQQYWRMRNARQDGDGNWIADAYDAGYSFTFGAEEAALLKAQGNLNDADIRQLESDRTTAYHNLHDSFGGAGFDPHFRYIANATEIAEIKEGSAWELHQLKYSVSKGAFSGNTANTDPRVEEPNVEGRNVTLIANKGSIGSTLADDIVIDISGGISGLTDAQRLALASAEIDDVSFDGDIITIVQRDDVDVHARGSITAMARDQIFLGGEQDINVSHIESPVIRIKGGQSIIDSQAGTPSIIGGDVILEAGNGAIGSAGNPLDLNVSGKLTARAEQAINIVQHGGNLTVDRLFTNDLASLNVLGGDLRQFSSEGVTLNAGSLNLITSGNVGSVGNAVSVQHGLAGKLMASTGGDLFITSPSSLLTLGDSQIGGQAQVHSAGRLFVDGDVQTIGEGAYTATGDISLADGAKLVSAAGIAIAASDVDMGEDSTIEAEDDVSITAMGDVTVAQITARRASGDAIDIAAGGRILSDGGNDLVANGADANVLLRAGQSIGSGVQALSVDAANLDAIAANGDIDLRLFADTRASRILAQSGAITAVADGALDYDTIEATGAIDLDIADSLSGGSLRSTAAGIAVRADSANLATVTAHGDAVIDTAAAQTLGTLTTGGDQTLTAGTALKADALAVGSALHITAESAEIITATVGHSADIDTADGQVLGSISSVGDQALTAGGLLSAGLLKTTAGDLTVAAGELVLTSGEISDDATLMSSGDQRIGRLVTGGELQLDAGGDVRYTTLTGDRNLSAAVIGHLQGGTANFAGNAAISAGSAELAHLQTGTSASVTTVDALHIENVVTGTSLALEAANASILLAQAGTTASMDAANQLTIGRLVSGGDQSLRAGGLLTADSVKAMAGDLMLHAMDLELEIGESSGSSTLITSGNQRIGSLSSGGSTALVAGGDIDFAVLDSGADLTATAAGAIRGETARAAENMWLTAGERLEGAAFTAIAGDLQTQSGRTTRLQTVTVGGAGRFASEGDFIVEHAVSGTSQTYVVDGALTAAELQVGSSLGVVARQADVGTAQVGTTANIDTTDALIIGSLASGGDQHLMAGGSLTADLLQTTAGDLVIVADELTLTIGEVGGRATLTASGTQQIGKLFSDDRMTLVADGDVAYAELVGGEDLVAVVAGRVQGDQAHFAGAADIQAGEVSLQQLQAGGTIDVFTDGGQRLGWIRSGLGQTLVAGAGLVADTLTVDAGDLRLSAAEASLASGEVGGKASLTTVGDQTIGQLISTDRQTIDAGGNVTYGSLDGGEDLIAAVQGHLDGGSAEFVGNTDIRAGSADLQRLQAGAVISVDTMDELRIGDASAGTSLYSRSGGAATYGNAVSRDQQTLHADGLFSADRLHSEMGSITIGDSLERTGSVNIASVEAATSFIVTTSGDQKLGVVRSGADQHLDAGGALIANTLDGRNLQVQAGSVSLGTGRFSGAVEVTTEGNQQITSLSSGDHMRLVSAAGGNGDIVFGSLKAGTPETVGESEERLAAPGITIEADGTLARLDASSGNAAAEGMLLMMANTFDVGDLASAGADVILEAVVDVVADSAHAKRDLKITAGRNMRIGDVDYGGEMSLKAGHNLWTKVGGDIRFASAEAGGNAEFFSGGEIEFDYLKAGGLVMLDAAGDVAVATGVDAGESITIGSGGNVTVGELTSEHGSIAISAAGDVQVRRVSAVLGDVAVTGANIRIDQLAADHGQLNAIGLLQLGHAGIARYLGLSGQDIAANVLQTGSANPFFMDLTGHAGAVADIVDLDVTTDSTLQFDRLYGKQLRLKTSSEHVIIGDAYVPGHLRMETPVAVVVAGNDKLSGDKADVTLHEQDYRFRLSQRGRHTDTNAYVVRYDRGYTVEVPNFSAAHTDGGPQVAAQSAFRVAERTGGMLRASEQRLSPQDFLRPQTLPVMVGDLWMPQQPVRLRQVQIVHFPEPEFELSPYDFGVEPVLLH